MIFRSSIFRHGNFRDGNQLHIIHSTYTSSVTSPGCTSFPLWYLLGYQLGQVLLQIQALHSCPVSKEKRLEMYCMLKLEISSYIYTRRDFFSIVQSPLLTDCEESYFQLTSLLLHLWSQEKKWYVDPNLQAWGGLNQHFFSFSFPSPSSYAASFWVDGANSSGCSKLLLFIQDSF